MDAYSVIQQKYDIINKIVYIRQTKKEYNDFAKIAEGFIETKRVSNENSLIDKGEKIQQRFWDIKSRFQMLPGEEIAPKQALYEEMVDNYIETLNKHQEFLKSEEKIGSTLKAAQNLIMSMKDNGGIEVLERVLEEIEELEKYFQGLTSDQLKNVLGIVNSELANNQIISFDENAQINFERLRATIARLKDSKKQVSQKTLVTNINREFGAIGELVATCANNAIMKTTNDVFQNATVTGTGAKQVQDGTGTVTAKSDAIFSATAKVNNEDVKIQLGLSFKTTGTGIKDGKWDPPESRGARVQIASISAKQKVWQMLKGIYGDQPISKNSLLNVLVWKNTNSKSVSLIQKSLVAHYFERFIAGGGGEISGIGYDQADILIVNGTPIPIYLILGKAIKMFDDENKSKIKFVTFDIETGRAKYKSSYNSSDDLVTKLEKSRQYYVEIINNMTMLVKLNGHMLKELAPKIAK